MLLRNRNPVGTPYTVGENLKRNIAMSRMYLNEQLLRLNEAYVLCSENWIYVPTESYIPTNALLYAIEY
jgi:hypothetical protein